MMAANFPAHGTIMLRIVSLPGAFVVACLALGGCGGGGGKKNAPPTAAALSISTAEDTPVQGNFSGTDPEGSTLTAAIASPPAKGDVAIASAGPLAFTYTPL